jgi:hypothetical protein
MFHCFFRLLIALFKRAIFFCVNLVLKACFLSLLSLKSRLSFVLLGRFTAAFGGLDGNQGFY